MRNCKVCGRFTRQGLPYCDVCWEMKQASLQKQQDYGG